MVEHFDDFLLDNAVPAVALQKTFQMGNKFGLLPTDSMHKLSLDFDGSWSLIGALTSTDDTNTLFLLNWVSFPEWTDSEGTKHEDIPKSSQLISPLLLNT